jgi:hypothetical protein
LTQQTSGRHHLIKALEEASISCSEKHLCENVSERTLLLDAPVSDGVIVEMRACLDCARVAKLFRKSGLL